MGKGGGKCASREQSASTPRLPNSRNPKTPAKASASSAKQSTKKEKAVKDDPTTLVPLIPKVRSFLHFSCIALIEASQRNIVIRLLHRL